MRRPFLQELACGCRKDEDRRVFLLVSDRKGIQLRKVCTNHLIRLGGRREATDKLGFTCKIAINLMCAWWSYTSVYKCWVQGSAVADKPVQYAALVNVLQTNKVDAQCDKLATKLSWQCFTAKVANLQHLHLTYPHLAPPLGVTPFEFCRDFRQQKTRVPRLTCAIAYVILFSCFSRTQTCDIWTDGQTDRRTTTANTNAS